MGSSNLKKPILALVTVAVFMTMRQSQKSIKNAKMGGLMSGNSIYSSPYGTSSSTSTSSYGTTNTGKKGWLSGLFGKKKAGATATGFSSYGGLSSPYGSTAGSSYSSLGGLRGGATGTSPYGSTLGGSGGLGGGLGSGTGGYGSTGTSGFGSTLGGTSSYGSSTMGGGSMGFGSSLSGGGLGGGGSSGKATADLIDSNPSSVMVVDPSIHFYDYGGSASFGGQIETVQAPDAPGMVTQVLSQPGQNKVLIVDGGGQMNSAILDGQAASTAMRNGWKGIIVYGAIRGTSTIQDLSLGVKALGTNPRKGAGSMGQRGGVVNIASAQFQNGWWVYADKDGILISQTDISGTGGYAGGSGSSFGGTSSFGSSGSSFGSSSLGGSSAFGGSSSTSMGGSSFGGSSMGGLGGSSSLGGSTYGGSTYGSGSMGGTSSFGGTSYGSSGTMGGSSLGSSLYGYGSSGGLGSYGKPATGGLGGYSSGGYSGYTAGSYGGYSGYAAKKKKNKVFKILLASSIAAIVWIVCLR